MRVIMFQYVAGHRRSSLPEEQGILTSLNNSVYSTLLFISTTRGPSAKHHMRSVGSICPQGALCACVEVRIGVGRNVGVGSRYGMNK